MIYLIGAGPGDPGLITVKAANILAHTPIAIYAGSLVNPDILDYLPKEAEIYNSATMTLEEVIAVFQRAHEKGLDVARIHTGDPSIYGAIQEQIDWLDEHEIPYTIIPGVSSFLAAAAALKQEFTLPGVSQTVILTRMEGRTAVPELESLERLAQHQSTMVIFLSVQMMEDVVSRLLKGYSPATPVAVVYKASWPEELILRGTLETITEQVKDAQITKTALIIVGDVLESEYELSKLYAADYSHAYRQAKP
ncbi:MAG: precorrin-4 C(11)-methyltransferase [Firmicutes bacterium]|nr:precorrin-4 C(11)-methyltransferase [Bacillota bacterium]